MVDPHGHSHGHAHGHSHGHDDEHLPALPHDPAQESLVHALQGSFNVLRILMIVLVLLYVWTGVFRVGPGQQGVVSRLGVLRQTTTAEGASSAVFPPGWHVSLPDPFDTKMLLAGELQTLTVTTFLVNHPEAATAPLEEVVRQQKAALEPGTDGAMLTGDKNLSHGRWEIQYRLKVADEEGSYGAADFVRNIANDIQAAEPLLRRLAETAIIREVAGRTVEEVTRTNLDSVRRGIQRRLQGSLDRLGAGIRVVEVVGDTIEPGRVRPAFDDVSRAENARLASIRQAEARATELLNQAAGALHPELLRLIRAYGEAQLREAPEAELTTLRDEIEQTLMTAVDNDYGEVTSALREARAEATRIARRWEAEYEEFLKHLQQRQSSPDVHLLGVWTRMRAKILGNQLNDIFQISPRTDDVQILINYDPKLLDMRTEEEATNTGRQ